MHTPSVDVILKRFEQPDEVRTFPKGRLELITLSGMTLGRATYEPGWKWSEHVGPTVGESRCHVEHVGLVLEGAATAAFDDGRVIVLRAGELFHIPAIAHDSWVVGDQRYSSLHFLGAAAYAAGPSDHHPHQSSPAPVVDELEKVMQGDAWYGDPVAKILAGVDADHAKAKPIPSAHSIWQLVRHMTAWTREVASRVAGHPAGEPALGDWPAASGEHADAWQKDVAALFEAHRELVTAIRALGPGRLAEPTNDPRNRELGTGVTREVMLHGLAQHHAYHAGQIALLKKGRS